LATVPGSNGKIYYQGPQSGEDGPADIYRVNPDGSEPQDLTPGAPSEERPNVSADGQHVVFQSFRDEGWNIFSMNADGSNQVDLTNTNFASEEVIDFEPTWSPDGSKVVFMHQDMKTGEQDLWSVNANSTGPVNLTNSPGINETSPEFSPDGSKIVYVSSGPELVGSPAYNNDIWVMNANGTGQTPLTETAQPIQNVAPTWSPDGSKIAYSVLEAPSAGEDGLHVMNANGTAQTQLLNESSPIPTYILSWSPDGTQIAYKSLSIGGELRLVGATGGASTLLVENSGADYPNWAPVAAPASGPATGPSPGTNGSAGTAGTIGSTGTIGAVKPNHFSFGKLKLNKKKGTASLIVTVPGAGSLVVNGKGVKNAKATTKAAGKVTLPIRAASRAKAKLEKTGKVKLALKITFTPGGGVANTESTKVTLKLLPAA
jgi:Tol biopolymer transport system component